MYDYETTPAGPSALVLHYEGRRRPAALHILDETSLGDRVAYDPTGDDLLTVVVHGEVVASLSSGERQLLRLLEAIAGVGAVNLFGLFSAVDREAAAVVVDAIEFMSGRDRSDLT